MRKLSFLILALTLTAAACNKTASVDNGPVAQTAPEVAGLSVQSPVVEQQSQPLASKPSTNNPKAVPATESLPKTSKDAEQDIKLDNLDNRVGEVEKKIESPAPVPAPTPVPTPADTVAPNVSMQTMINSWLSNDYITSNGGALYGTIGLWSYIAQDPQPSSGLAKVEYYLDGSLVGSATDFNSKIAWDTTKHSNGSHELSAKVYDKEGNVAGGSAQISINNNPEAGQPCKVSGFGTVQVIVNGVFPQDSDYKIWPSGQGQIGVTSKENQTINHAELGSYSVKVYTNASFEVSPPSATLEACKTLTFTINLPQE